MIHRTTDSQSDNPWLFCVWVGVDGGRILWLKFRLLRNIVISLDADYKNLKIFHFWANRTVGSFFGILGFFLLFISNFVFELSDSESKKAKNKIVTWSTFNHFQPKYDLFFPLALWSSTFSHSSFPHLLTYLLTRHPTLSGEQISGEQVSGESLFNEYLRLYL